MLGEKIATHRNSKGLTQAQLGRLIGVGQSTVAMYECDAIRPSWRRLEKLTAVFGVALSPTPLDVQVDGQHKQKAIEEQPAN